MNMTRVRVRRERPTALALAVALCVTMLVVYVLTLDAKGPEVVQSVAAAPRVTREITLEPLSGWCVSMATCKSQQEARLQASAWVGRGAAGCVREFDGEWRVLGAIYDSRREAERVSKRLTDDEGIPAEAVPLEAKAIKLRVTAPQTQIEAVAGADALLRAQTRQMGAAAMQLDKGEINADAARTLCALAATEASEMAEALGAIPGAAENALCTGLEARLIELAQMQDTVAGSVRADATALSGMLRCAQIENFMGQWALMKGVGG